MISSKSISEEFRENLLKVLKVDGNFRDIFSKKKNPANKQF
jgi:hypothetical protein